jgi:uncharacterized membrane protein
MLRRTLSPPERFVILVLLGFGLVACLATPISAGYDEETHFIRAWEMAHLYFIPNEQLGSRLPFPALYWELSYRRQPIVEAADPGIWTKYGSLPLDAHDYVYANVETRSVYSPALLLPQALALRYLGLSLGLPALPVYYACRFVGLLSYLILGWLAVRLIPFGKWLLAALVASPMALYQASTISADTISNGIGFLFVGATLAIAAVGPRNIKALSLRGGRSTGSGRHQSDRTPGSEAAQIRDLGWKHWVALLALIAILFLAKVNLIFLALLPFVLIAPSRFRMRRGFLLLAGAALLLLLVEVAGWNVVAYSKFTRALQGADPRAQLLFIASNPLLFVGIIARDIWAHSPSYMQGWIGVYGYDYWPVPALTYLLYPLAVAAALWQPVDRPVPDRRTRLVLVVLFVLGYLLTIVSLYVAFTPVRSLAVAGVQGRYFTVVMPLLFLALLFPSRVRRRIPDPSAPSSQLSEPPQQSPLEPGGGGTSEKAALAFEAPGTARRSAVDSAIPGIVWILASCALTLYVAGLILSYHVPCGSQYYRLDLCYQPQYKNWAPEDTSSPAIGPTMILTQEIVAKCSDMTDVRVWVNSNGSDRAGTTTLSLRAPTEEKDVVTKTISNASISPGGWITAAFPVEAASLSQLYLLKLTGSSPNGIHVGYSEKAEYLGGKLFENDQPVSQDILFQYGCVAGLRKLMTPSLP